MNRSIILPQLQVDINTLNSYSQEISMILNNSIVYVIGGVSYYLFRDVNGRNVIYVKESQTTLMNDLVFKNITKLPVYTNNDKVEFFLLINIIGYGPELYNTRLFI